MKNTKEFFDQFTSDEIDQLNLQENQLVKLAEMVECLREAEKDLGKVHSFTIKLRKRMFDFQNSMTHLDEPLKDKLFNLTMLDNS